MSGMMVETLEFKGDDELARNEHDILEVVDATPDGLVEVAIDLTPKAERLYIKFPLHELVRLAMIHGRKEKS